MVLRQKSRDLLHIENAIFHVQDVPPDSPPPPPTRSSS